MLMQHQKQPAYKIEAPNAKKIMRFDQELRFDLPYALLFPNLLYIAKAVSESWYTPSHYHDYFEVCYIASGTGWFSLEGTLYEVQEGDLFVTKPGEGHFGAATAGQPYVLYAFGVQFSQMRDMENAFYKIGMNRVANNEGRQISSYCDSIMTEIDQDTSFSYRMVQGLFMEMIVYVLRVYENHIIGNWQGPVTLTQEIRKVLEFIHADFSYMSRIQELAQRVSLSRAHLDREFKRIMGINLGEYIRAMCIDRSKHVLKQTTDSITAIAEKLGFDSLHAFSVFFKRHTGMSPQQYRSRISSSEQRK